MLTLFPFTFHNRILLRVKLLYYLKSDVIGDFADDVLKGASARDLPIPQPLADGDPPSSWWDEECDKSLLIGVFKHGYDRYNLMRQDSSLCFLQRCGPPDGAALLAEIQDDGMEKLEEDEEPETPATPATIAISENNKETKDNSSSAPEDVKSDEAKPETPTENNNSSENSDVTPAPETTTPYEPFPSRADMNQRLRRIVTSYQRQFRRQEIRMAQQARHQQRLEKLERFEAAIREREVKKREQAQR